MPQDTRERMLATTQELLLKHGLHGTSLNDILSRSGAPRGSLYYYFPRGKAQLAFEATALGVEMVTQALEELLDKERPPVAVRAYFDAAASALRESDFVFGCPVAPLVLDIDDPGAELAELCRKTIARWQKMLRDAFVNAGIPTARAASLATLTVSALEGALLIARTERSTQPISVVAEEVTALIEGALSPK